MASYQKLQKQVILLGRQTSAYPLYCLVRVGRNRIVGHCRLDDAAWIEDTRRSEDSNAAEARLLGLGESLRELLKLELVRIPKRAKLSEKQGRIWYYCVVMGLDTDSAASAMDVTPGTVRVHLLRALGKVRKLPHLGVFTVLVEEFGFDLVREVMRLS